MLLVLLRTRAGHEDVVNVGVREGETTKYLVNKALEGLRSVAKAEWHFKKFESPKGVVIAVFGISAGLTGI